MQPSMPSASQRIGPSPPQHRRTNDTHCTAPATPAFGPSRHFACAQRSGRSQVKSGHQIAGRTDSLSREMTIANVQDGHRCHGLKTAPVEARSIFTDRAMLRDRCIGSDGAQRSGLRQRDYQRVGPASAPFKSVMAASNWLAEVAIVNLCSSRKEEKMPTTAGMPFISTRIGEPE